VEEIIRRREWQEGVRTDYRRPKLPTAVYLRIAEDFIGHSLKMEAA
jgi:hypothetical protein